MTTQEKETLLKALKVLRSIAKEQQAKLVQHGREFVKRTRPHLNKMTTKSANLWQSAKTKARSVEVPKKEKLVAFSLAGTAAILVGAQLSQMTYSEKIASNSETVNSTQSPPSPAIQTISTAPQPTAAMKAAAAKLKAQQEATAKLKAQQEAHKALVQQRIAEADLMLKEQQAKAAEKARQAQIVAQKTKHKATLARIQSSSTNRSSGSSLFDLGLGRSSNRPVELGIRPSTRYQPSPAVNRDMRRYQKHLSGVMAARGVR